MSRRLPNGGTLLDRGRSLRFELDGVTREGLTGDTLASAALAAGIVTWAPSLYRARPRGPLTAGRSEPTAFAQVVHDGLSEPMLAATEVELIDGLRAQTLSGRGRLDPAALGDGVRNDHAHAHCDVLVVGAGPAALAAADAASAGGARVILVAGGPRLGGGLLDAGPGEAIVDGLAPLDWVAAVEARLTARPEVRILRRSTAAGLYDEGYAVVAERRAAGRRLWHVRAGRVVLATGAYERSIAFAGNDLPGVMLASAARAYVRRWAVAPGRRAVVFTTNDSAYGAAAALADAGVEVAAVIDARAERSPAAATLHGIDVRTGQAVVEALGEQGVEGVRVAPIEGDGDGPVREIAADALLVSGGWTPAAELLCHAGGRLRYDARRVAYLPPAEGHRRVRSAGAAAGCSDLAEALADGWARGREAATAVGQAAPSDASAPVTDPPPATAPPRALWLVPSPDGRWDSHFVDLQRDVTVADLQRAVRAGLRSPEHIKRYTTLGTGADQGRTSGVLGLGVVAQLLGVGLEKLSPTTARPPATPLSFALLAGRNRGELHDPVRVTPMHERHLAAGAVFEDVGQWKRPWYYPLDDEDRDAAVARECRAVREGVGMMDVSTLGKIDVHGPDATAFLNRMYTGDFAKLAPGMCKYGILCHADGMVFDDGVTMRLTEDRYLVTTTTGNAAAVLEWFEEWLQTEWPELRVHCTSVTEQWATVAIAGPRARDVLAPLAVDLALDNESFPFMAIREAEVAGLPARVCRVSFSGELAFEVNVAGHHGIALWDAIAATGAPYQITPYGTETMHVLRAEKGYFIVGQDTDGTVTPQDLGYGWAVAKRKGDFVGRRSHVRPDTAREDRKHLVALLPARRVAEGAQVVLEPSGAVPVPIAGHVTSSYDSVALERPFALALVRGGRARIGETVHVSHDGGWVAATVAEPVLYDPEGARRDGYPAGN